MKLVHYIQTLIAPILSSPVLCQEHVKASGLHVNDKSALRIGYKPFDHVCRSEHDLANAREEQSRLCDALNTMKLAKEKSDQEFQSHQRITEKQKEDIVKDKARLT